MYGWQEYFYLKRAENSACCEKRTHFFVPLQTGCGVHMHALVVTCFTTSHWAAKLTVWCVCCLQSVKNTSVTANTVKSCKINSPAFCVQNSRTTASCHITGADPGSSRLVPTADHENLSRSGCTQQCPPGP